MSGVSGRTRSARPRRTSNSSSRPMPPDDGDLELGSPNIILKHTNATADLFANAPPFCIHTMVLLNLPPDDVLHDTLGTLNPDVLDFMTAHGRTEAAQEAAADLHAIPTEADQWCKTLPDFITSTKEMRTSEEIMRAFEHTATVFSAVGNIVKSALRDDNPVVLVKKKASPFNPVNKGKAILFRTAPNQSFDAEVFTVEGDMSMTCTFNPRDPPATYEQIKGPLALGDKPPTDFFLQGMPNSAWQTISVGLDGQEQPGGPWVDVASKYPVQLRLMPIAQGPVAQDMGGKFQMMIHFIWSNFYMSYVDKWNRFKSPIARTSDQAVQAAYIFCQEWATVKPIKRTGNATHKVLLDGTRIGPDTVATKQLSSVLDTQELVAKELGGGVDNVVIDESTRIKIVAMVPTPWEGKQLNGAAAADRRWSMISQAVFHCIFTEDGLTPTYAHFLAVMQTMAGAANTKGPPKQTWDRDAMNGFAVHTLGRMMRKSNVCTFGLDDIFTDTSIHKPSKDKRSGHAQRAFIMSALALLPGGKARRVTFDPQATVDAIVRSPEFMRFIRWETRKHDAKLARQILGCPIAGLPTLEAFMVSWYKPDSETSQHRNIGMWQAFVKSNNRDLLIRAYHVAVAEWLDEACRECVTHDALVEADSVLALAAQVLITLKIDGVSSYYTQYNDANRSDCPGVLWMIMYLVRDIASTACNEVEVHLGTIKGAELEPREYYPFMARYYPGLVFLAADMTPGAFASATTALQALGMHQVLSDVTGGGIELGSIGTNASMPDCLLLTYDLPRIRCTETSASKRPKWANRFMSEERFFTFIQGYASSPTTLLDDMERLAKPHAIVRFTTWDVGVIPDKDAVATDMWLTGGNIVGTASPVRVPDVLATHNVPQKSVDPWLLKSLGYYFDDWDDCMCPTYVVPIPIRRDGEKAKVIFGFFLYCQASITAPYVLVSDEQSMDSVASIQAQPKQKLLELLLDSDQTGPYEKAACDIQPQAALGNGGPTDTARRTPAEPYQSLGDLVHAYRNMRSHSKYTLVGGNVDDVFIELVRTRHADKPIVWRDLADGVHALRDYLYNVMGIQGYEKSELHYIFGTKLVSTFTCHRWRDEATRVMNIDAALDKARSERLAFAQQGKRKATESLCQTAKRTRGMQYLALDESQRKDLDSACLHTLLQAADEIEASTANVEAIEEYMNGPNTAGGAAPLL